jgi:hypothetical protein
MSVRFPIQKGPNGIHEKRVIEERQFFFVNNHPNFIENMMILKLTSFSSIYLFGNANCGQFTGAESDFSRFFDAHFSTFTSPPGKRISRDHSCDLRFSRFHLLRSTMIWQKDAGHGVPSKHRGQSNADRIPTRRKGRRRNLKFSSHYVKLTQADDGNNSCHFLKEIAASQMIGGVYSAECTFVSMPLHRFEP